MELLRLCSDLFILFYWVCQNVRHFQFEVSFLQQTDYHDLAKHQVRCSVVP